jgi:hypothetical protein
VDLISKNKTNKQPSFIDRLVWPVPLAQVLPHPQRIFPSKTWFFGIYLNFQQQKSVKNSISSIPIPSKISILKKLLHCKSKCHGTKPMHPSSLRAFRRH